jgi:anti-anti-sigma regulatory factor
MAARKPAKAAKPATRLARGPVAIALGADLRIGQARDLHARLLAARKAGEVVLDGAEVAKVDAAGLQALAAALVTLRTAGVAWRWQTPSGTLSAAAALAGLEATLQLE